MVEPLPGVSHPQASAEPGEIRVPWIIAGAVGAFVLFAAACLVGIYFIYLPFAREEAIAVSDFPAPQLQPAPRLDLEGLQAQQRARLGEARWIDRDRGVAQIPIEAAMALIATRGSAAFDPIASDVPGVGAEARPDGAAPPADRPADPGADAADRKGLPR